MSQHDALNPLDVLERVLKEQAGSVTPSLVEAVYSAALKHQYDVDDDGKLQQAIRTLVTDYVSVGFDQENGMTAG